MKIIPDSVVGRAYVKGTLAQMQNGFTFELSNEFGALTLTKVEPITVDDEQWPVAGISFVTPDGSKSAASISKQKPWRVPKGNIKVRVQGMIIDSKDHQFKLPLQAKMLGRLDLSFSDSMERSGTESPKEKSAGQTDGSGQQGQQKSGQSGGKAKKK